MLPTGKKPVSMQHIASVREGRLEKALDEIASGEVEYQPTQLAAKFGKPLFGVKKNIMLFAQPKPTPKRKAKRRRHKMAGTPCEGATTGKSYPSLIERDYHELLLIRERVGEVKEVEYQPSYTLVAGIKYKADFKYTVVQCCPEEAALDVKTGDTIVVDTKGNLLGDRFRMVMKLWAEKGPGPLHVVKRKGSNDLRFYVWKKVIPKNISPCRSA